jgi:hypothetical protein
MENLERPESTSSREPRIRVHSWDTQTRSAKCGAPGQSGSTKHARGVTCDACLELLGRPSRPRLVPTTH